MTEQINSEKKMVTAEDIAVGDKLPALDVEMSAKRIISGATAARDWQPLHHDHMWAVETARTGGIILNTPSQAGWITKYLTDFFGPQARLGKMRFKMRSSILPEHTMRLQGEVKSVEPGGVCGTWVELEVNLVVGEKPATLGTVRVAIPDNADGPNPWQCPKEQWQPKWAETE